MFKMNNKNQAQKNDEINQLKSFECNDGQSHYEFAKEMGLILPEREVQSLTEYYQLILRSKRKLQDYKHPNSFWIEGYAIKIEPVVSKENINVIEFSLENGDFFNYVFVLEDGLNDSYLRYLEAINVYEAKDYVPADVLIRRCGFLLLEEWISGEKTYVLHDVCPADELSQRSNTHEKVISEKAYLAEQNLGSLNSCTVCMELPPFVSSNSDSGMMQQLVSILHEYSTVLDMNLDHRKVCFDLTELVTEDFETRNEFIELLDTKAGSILLRLMDVDFVSEPNIVAELLQ